MTNLARWSLVSVLRAIVGGTKSCSLVNFFIICPPVGAKQAELDAKEGKQSPVTKPESPPPQTDSPRPIQLAIHSTDSPESIHSDSPPDSLVLTLASSGASIRDIAKATNLSIGKVQRILARRKAAYAAADLQGTTTALSS